MNKDIVSKIGLASAIFFLLLKTTSVSQTAAVESILELDRKWTGDLDGMVERHKIRVLVPYSKTLYFLDGAKQAGLTYEGMRIFEWGKIFIARKGELQPTEKTLLAAALAGPCGPKTWYGEPRETDFYDIKGAVEGLLEALGVKSVSYRKGLVGPEYESAASAGIFCSKDPVGYVGQLSRKAAESYGFTRSKAFLFEIDVPALLEHIPAVRRCEPFARFPAVYRDISLVVNRSVECGTMVEIIRREGGDLLESVQLFDMYEGGNLNPSEKAVGFRMCYRSKEETLEGGVVNRLHESIIRKLGEETGGKLREA